MKEKPSEVDDGSPSRNPYVLQAKTIQTSLSSMKERVAVLAMALEDTINVTVDHPFLFLIQDNPTGTILFIGQVVEPVQ